MSEQNRSINVIFGYQEFGKVRALSIWSNFTVVLDELSYAWAWGTQTTGDGTNIQRSSPVSVLGGRQYQQVLVARTSSSPAAVYLLDSFNYAWAWGNNSSGQLGDNTTTTRSSPVSVVGGRRFRTLVYDNADTTAPNNILGIDLNSYAWAWGVNTNGSLGDNGTANRSSPVSVVGGKQWLSITQQPAGGSNGFIGIDSLSYAWAWGHGGNGKLGTLSIVNRSSPVSVFGGIQWRSVFLSRQDSVHGLDLNSYAWSWGSNNSGRLGNNGTANTSSPVSVVGGRQWLLLEHPALVMRGLDNLSYAWGWGNNFYGELGDNTTSSKSSPVSLLGGKQWSQFIKSQAGMNGSALIDTNGYLWTVGNMNHAIANSLNSYSSPISVVGGRQVSNVFIHSAGGMFLTNSSVFGWSTNANGYGRFGDTANTAMTSSPVAVALLRTIAAMGKS